MEGCGETLHASARQPLLRVAADLASWELFVRERL
jgi:hypothetical protein